MTTIKISDLVFVRAGSDFLGFCWSAHVTGFEFQAGHRYTIDVEDGTSYEVIAEKRQYFNEGGMTWHLVDPDAGTLLGF